MSSSFSVTLDGEKDLLKKTKTIEMLLKSPTKPLVETSDMFRGAIQKQHSSEGREFLKKKWQKLSPRYKKWKESKFPGKKRLQLTGRIKSSYRSRILKDELIIHNTSPVFRTNETGRNLKGLPIPVRKVMVIDKKREKLTVRIFNKYIRSLLK